MTKWFMAVITIPNRWTPDTWQEDARLMQEAGVNLVTLAVFAWGKLEPAEGQYDFTWLDQVIDLLFSHGVRVDLATSTASPPPWLVRQYPEILPVTAEGVTLWHGSRRHYCPHSPAYRQHAAQLVTALAGHYREHPAISLWHVDNEYACHISECFCEASVAAFRQWLQGRYGTLENLNQAWGTAFWSQQYYDWQEIQAPKRTPAFINPSQRLDWERFCSDSWLACFEEQKAILHAITPDLPVTTNFMSFHRPLDYWKFAASEDIVSFDCYPDTSLPDWMVESGMGFDLMRFDRKWAPLAFDGAGPHARQLAPTKHHQTSRHHADGQLSGNGTRLEWDHVLPMACIAGRRREIPQRHAAACRHRFACVARSCRAWVRNLKKLDGLPFQPGSG